MNKGIFRLGIVSFLLVVLILFIIPSFAASFESTAVPSVVNTSTANQIINFTINNTDSYQSIIQVNITIPTGFNFIADSNSTTAPSTMFSNISNLVFWINTTQVGFIENNSVQYFSFNTSVPTVPSGSYIFTVATKDTNGTTNATNVTIVVNDTVYPTWSANQSYSPPNYSSSTPSSFNITWIDNVGINNVVITITNSTNVLVSNASMTNDTYGESIYNYSAVLPAGNLNWTSYANDTSGNWNKTDTFYFTVAQADNPISLYLNGTEGNVTYYYPSSTNATATAAGGTVYLYRNETHLVNGTSPRSETIRLTNGTYIYKINATGNANYSDNTTPIIFYAFVNKGILNLSINITPSSPVLLSQRTNVTGIETNIGDDDIVYELRRDSVPVTNYNKTGNETWNVNESAVLGLGTFNYTFNATGNENWTANASGVWATLTVQESGTSGFIPSGGSGTVPIVTAVTREQGSANITVQSLSSGRELNITILKTEDLAIRKISISAVKSVNNVVIRITKLQGVPSTIPYGISGTVYHYINIENENITDSDVNRTIIRFAVTKTWLTDNNLNYSRISLYRWANNAWNELSTNYSFNDTFEMFYEAISPGFSTFAIGTSGAGTLATETEQPACTELWSCTGWSECINGTQNRTCTDDNSCGTTEFEPEEFQECGTSVAEVKPFPIFEVAIIIVISLIIVVFVILELTGKLHLSNIRKSVEDKGNKVETFKPPQRNVEYYYTKKDSDEENGSK